MEAKSGCTRSAQEEEEKMSEKRSGCMSCLIVLVLVNVLGVIVFLIAEAVR